MLAEEHACLQVKPSLFLPDFTQCCRLPVFLEIGSHGPCGETDIVQLRRTFLQYFFANASMKRENIYSKIETRREEKERGKQDRGGNGRHAAVYRIQ
jgi:hypothetical protein